MNNQQNEFYRQKYLKYKAKYLEAKNQVEGGRPTGIATGDVKGIGTRKCKDLSHEEANCRISQDCVWNQNPKSGKTEDRCEEKPCDKYWFKASCPTAESAEGKVRDVKCKWDGGKVLGRCLNA
jgi:hypothetical protein